MQLLFAGVKCLLISFALVSYVSADFHIGLSLSPITLLAPLNTLADGSCCDSSCGTNMTCCEASSIRCDPTVRICFRRSEHPVEDDDSECPQVVTLEDTSSILNQFGDSFDQTRDYYTGGFQAYIRISHVVSGTQADFDPPFENPLIDEIFLEFSNLTVETFVPRLLAPLQTLTMTGTVGRVEARLTVSVHCAENWMGEHCEYLCTDSSFTNCTLIYTGPTTEAVDVSSTNPATTSDTFILPTTGGVAVVDDLNVVGIAVGVSIGAFVLIFILVLLVILICVCCIRRARSKGEFRPQKTNTVAYTVKPRTAADIQVVRDLEGQDDASALYTPVLKKKSVRSSSGPEDAVEEPKERTYSSPPPVPPYSGDDEAEVTLGYVESDGDSSGEETQGVTVVFNQSVIEEIDADN